MFSTDTLLVFTCKMFVFLSGSMKIHDGSLDVRECVSNSEFVGYSGFQNAIGEKKYIEKNNQDADNSRGSIDGSARRPDANGELRSMGETIVGAYLQELH